MARGNKAARVHLNKALQKRPQGRKPKKRAYMDFSVIIGRPPVLFPQNKAPQELPLGHRLKLNEMLAFSDMMGRKVGPKNLDRRSYERARGPSLHSEGVSKLATRKVALFASKYTNSSI